MEEQYGMGDLRQYMNGRAIFPPIPPPPDLLTGHRTLTPAAHHYEMVMGMGRHPIDMVNPGGVGAAGGGLHQHHHHHHHHQPHHQLELIRPDSNTNSATTASTIPCGGGGGSGLGGAGGGGGGAIGIGFMSTTCGGLEMDGAGLGVGDGGNGRWPRQETLTLLEIRSRLDSKFKEANQKGPLWDEVSRIMSEEHGYQRSGKKCREKFENLYKYYKKTKEGKAGRQDGKHYRFFRQLEALYGESNNASASASENHHLIGNSSVRYNAANNSASISNQEPSSQCQKLSADSLSLSNNSSDFDTTSSEDSDLNLTGDNDSIDKRRKRKGKRSWKAKIRDFIDSQMRKLMEKQEAWLEKIMKTIEQKEQERLMREEEWRKQEAARVEREHKFWANERSWIESRDAAMMEALRTLTGKEVLKALPTHDQENVVAELQSMTKNNQNDNGSHETINSIIKGDGWPECEITRLIQLRTSMEARFHQIGCPEEILWEEIATKMACLGYDRTPLMCKDKWDSISTYLIKCSKKRKENSRFGCYLANNESVTSQGGTYSCDTNDQGLDQTVRQAQNDQGASPPNHDSGNNVIHDGSYRFVMDAENLWENYGVRFSKGNNH